MDKLNSNDGVQDVVNAIHKRDPLSFVLHVYKDFNSLLPTRRGREENIKNFETRFQAQL